MASDVISPSFSILIVDDSSAMRAITADILESFGYVVYQAGTGQEGVALFQEHAIDLVILDVNMPDMDGAQTYRELLMLDPKVNVIVYSSDSQTAVSKKFAPLAVPYYLHKPVDTNLLFDTVEVALNGPELLTHPNSWQEESVLLA